jgi:outer membrane protein with beta-barrel domain
MIRRCALSAVLSLSAAVASQPVHAQAVGTTGTTVNGRVVVQVFVTLSDEATMYHPVAGLPLGFTRSARDTAIAVTDKSGSAVILLPPGQYRVVSLMPTQWKGMRYSWNTPVVVREEMSAVDLRRADAMVSRAVTTVTTVSNGETAPSIVERAPAPAPAPVRSAPVQAEPAPMPAPSKPAPVVAQVDAPAAVPAPTPAALAPVMMPARADTAAKAEAPRRPAPTRSSMERSRSKGFFLGLGVEGSGIQTNVSGSTAESGGGGGLVVGYGFSKRWSLYTDVSDAVMTATGGGTYSLAHADLGARIHFRSGAHALVPFLQVGATGRAVSTTAGGVTYTGSGGGATLGMGFNAYFTRAAAVSAAASWSVGNFDKFQVDNVVVGTTGASVNAQTARVHLGLVWFP